MEKEFNRTGIDLVKIKSKGSSSIKISSQPGLDRIKINIPDKFIGIAKKEGDMITIATICDDEPAQVSMPGFDMRGQTVHGAQTNIGNVHGAVFCGTFKSGVTVNGSSVVTNEAAATLQEISVTVPNGLKVICESIGGNIVLAGHSGDVNLIVDSGKIKAIDYHGNLDLVLKGEIKADVDLSKVGDLTIHANGSGQVRVSCIVHNLSVKTTGINVTVKDYSGINAPCEVSKAVFMILDRGETVKN